MLHLIKCVYGLNDAPKAWQLRLDKQLESLGYKPFHLDKCIYSLHDKAGKLCALVSTHVDDLKCANDKSVLEALTRSLEGQFGKCNVQWDDFVHYGIKHTRATNGTVTTNQNHYGHQILPIKTFTTAIPARPVNINRLFITTII